MILYWGDGNFMFDSVNLKSVNKSYGVKQALKNINLNIESGKIVGLLGPNGSGKTTMIKLMVGLTKPSSGIVTICGHEPGKVTKSYVSYLPDKDFLDINMSIEDTMRMFAGFYSDFDIGIAYKLLEDLQVPYKFKIKALSKGNREKLILILVMSRRAKLYVLDEPIAGVDPVARDYILNTIVGNYNKTATVIISTHLIADVEKILDDVIFIKDGEIILHETSAAIRNEKGCSVDEYFREVYDDGQNDKVRI